MYRLYLWCCADLSAELTQDDFKKNAKKFSTVGFELTTISFKGLSSTDWASRAMMWKE